MKEPENRSASRILKRLMHLFFGLCFLVLLALAVELGERIWIRFVAQDERIYWQRKGVAHESETVRVESTPVVAGYERPTLPSRDSFVESTGEARLKLMRTRNETALVCERDGTVRAIYVGLVTGDLAGVLGSLHPGDSAASPLRGLGSATPEAQQRIDDMLTMLRQVKSDDRYMRRDYDFTLPNGRTCLMECSFAPLTRPGEAGRVVMFVRDSIWQTASLRYRANIRRDDLFKDWQFSTNAQGWRGKDIDTPKPRGVFRIVCVGGSTTVEGRRDDLTYPALLERKLRTYFGTDCIDVVNCGVFALSAAQEVKLLPDYLALEPDLMVYYNFANEVTSGMLYNMRLYNPGHARAVRLREFLMRSLFLYRHATSWVLPPDDLIDRWLCQSPLASIQTVADGVRAQGGMAAICSYAYPDTPRTDWRERAFFDFHLRRFMGSEKGPDGFPVTILGYDHLVDRFNVQVKRQCAEKGLIYVPVGEQLKGGSETFSDHCHLFCAGIETKAQIVFEAIKDYVGEQLKRE